MLPSPDHVCKKYAAKKARITIRSLPGDENVLLIEGDRKGLEFLGELLLAQARTSDCGFQLEPAGSGGAFFRPGSTVGLCLHRIHKTAHRKNSRRNGKANKVTAKAGA